MGRVLLKGAIRSARRISSDAMPARASSTNRLVARKPTAGVGFEPTGALSGASGFQDRPIRPLWHPALLRLSQRFRGAEPHEHLRNGNRAVLLLEVLQDRERPPVGYGGAVQGVHVLRAAVGA